MQQNFLPLEHIMAGMEQKGGEDMEETRDTYADVDDLIFSEEDGGPSQR